MAYSCHYSSLKRITPYPTQGTAYCLLPAIRVSSCQTLFPFAVLSLPIKTHSHLPVMPVPPVMGAAIHQILLQWPCFSPNPGITSPQGRKKSRLKGDVWGGTVAKQEKRIFSWHRLAS